MCFLNSICCMIERYEVISYMSDSSSACLLMEGGLPCMVIPVGSPRIQPFRCVITLSCFVSHAVLPPSPFSYAHSTTMTPRPWKANPVSEAPNSESSTVNLLLRDSKRTSDMRRIDSWGTFSVRCTRFYFSMLRTDCDSLDGYSLRSRSRVDEFQAVIHHRQG
jgi:hypothetical protein